MSDADLPPMEYRKLGRCGLRVSRVSIGAGGLNTWGQRTPRKPEREIRALIRQAHDWGVNLFDVAPAYCDAEGILGRAFAGVPRDRWHVSTKVKLGGDLRDRLATPQEIRQTVENSLRRMRTDTIDILLVTHWPDSWQYSQIVETLLPVLRRLQRDGKIRALGSTEITRRDGSHEWLTRALRDNLFDVVMAGYNMVNQSAERAVFPLCRRHDVGVMSIFTARRAFTRVERIAAVIRDLVRRGIVPDGELDPEQPLSWLLDEEMPKLVHAAYRFSAASEDVTTIVSGTINPEHLRENIAMVLGRPFPADDYQRLKELFGHVAEPVGN